MSSRNALGRLRHGALAGGLVLVTGISSCALFEGQCGSDAGRVGLDLTVIDSTTGIGPVSTPVVVVVRDGSYSESAQGPVLEENRLRFLAAIERPGSYVVTVTAPGYREWTGTGITVARRGRCDKLETQQITIRLQPQ